MKKIINRGLLCVLFLSASVFAENAADFQRLMSKAEVDFPSLFAPSNTDSLFLAGATSDESWVYRNYTESGVLIGIQKGVVYGFGGSLWKEVTVIGSLNELITGYVGFDEAADKAEILEQMADEDNPCFNLPLVAAGTGYNLTVTADNKTSEHFARYLTSNLTGSHVTTTNLQTNLVSEVIKKYHFDQNILLLDELTTKLPASDVASEITKDTIFSYTPAVKSLQKLCGDSTWSSEVSARRIDDTGNDTTFELLFNGEVVRMEEVTVPAGTFASVVVAETSESDEGEQISNNLMWFDIQTGIAVKVENRDEFGAVSQKIELSSF